MKKLEKVKSPLTPEWEDILLLICLLMRNQRENTLRAIAKPSDAIDIRQHKKINSFTNRKIIKDDFQDFQSYTISRENSFSPDSCEFQYFEKKEKTREETDM